ncbi:MAG TPA: hypothetical protein VM512_02940 [Burkholderiaceae bacterium]|nr:hypothetical protein [Burkholderiaceae bacterium]
MSGFTPHPEGDGIPLLTEIVDLDATPTSHAAAPVGAAAAAPAVQPEPPEALPAAALPSDVQIPSFQYEPLEAGMVPVGASHASLPPDEILQQFRATWPAIIEAECQEAVQAALRQFSEQLVETLSVHLTITLQARLETWLEARLRS